MRLGTLFIRLEFDVNAACAVLLVVSTPKETVTLSGFVWFDAEPDTTSVLFVMSVWALTLVKLYSIAVRIATERITIAWLLQQYLLCFYYGNIPYNALIHSEISVLRDLSTVFWATLKNLQRYVCAFRLDGMYLRE